MLGHCNYLDTFISFKDYCHTYLHINFKSVSVPKKLKITFYKISGPINLNYIKIQIHMSYCIVIQNADAFIGPLAIAIFRYGFIKKMNDYVKGQKF